MTFAPRFIASRPCYAPPPGPGPVVAVCVPVRDEAALLPRLLDALDGQTGVDPARVLVCLFFDGCADDGIGLVRARAPAMRCRVQVAPGERAVVPNAGRARAKAMALGSWALRDEAGAVLLSTDADSVPRADWIARSCRALGHADVVAGRIVREGSARDGAQSRIEAYYDRLYALRRLIDPVAWEPAEAHHFTGGASLGFRASAYAALGGFSPRASGEDALIVDEAARAGLRVRRDRDVVVQTSSRLDGRAVGGLSSMLGVLERRCTDLIPVAHPADQSWQWRAQAHARRAFDQLDQAPVRVALGARLGLTPDHVLGVVRDCPNAEAFAMRVVPTVSGGVRTVGLAEAEHALSQIARQSEARAA